MKTSTDRGVQSPTRVVLAVLTLVMAAGSAPAHAECGCWRFVRPTGSTLGEVTAPAANAAWATGSRGSRPALLAWNGRQWRDSPLAVPSTTILEGVSASSRKNAWVVGFDPWGVALAAHWNGRAWKKVPFPKAGPTFLRAVDSRTTEDTWAVGSTSGFAGSQAAVWHWNGAAWKTTPARSPLGSELSAVSAVSATQAWAVGTQGKNPLILRWDGRTWAPSPTPKIEGEATLTDVAGTWAVGTSFAGTEKPLALHWDGRAWAVSPVPGTGRLASVAEDGRGGVWAAGETSDGRATLAHWNGRFWDLSSAPSPLGEEEETLTGPSSVWGLAHVPGTAALWAVGTARNAAMTWTNAPRPR
ncbi:MAG: hypothetical protein ABIS86_18600 [Streptosporangiaceae bacterium]